MLCAGSKKTILWFWTLKAICGIGIGYLPGATLRAPDGANNNSINDNCKPWPTWLFPFADRSGDPRELRPWDDQEGLLDQSLQCFHCNGNIADFGQFIVPSSDGQQSSWRSQDKSKHYDRSKITRFLIHLSFQSYFKYFRESLLENFRNPSQFGRIIMMFPHLHHWHPTGCTVHCAIPLRLQY